MFGWRLQRRAGWRFRPEFTYLQIAAVIFSRCRIALLIQSSRLGLICSIANPISRGPSPSQLQADIQATTRGGASGGVASPPSGEGLRTKVSGKRGAIHLIA